jgi:hypothetical protein
MFISAPQNGAVLRAVGRRTRLAYRVTMTDAVTLIFNCLFFLLNYPFLRIA